MTSFFWTGRTVRREGGDVSTICVDSERFIINAYEKHELQAQMAAAACEKELRYIGSGEPRNEIKNFPLEPLSTAFSFLLRSETVNDGGNTNWKLVNGSSSDEAK